MDLQRPRSRDAHGGLHAGRLCVIALATVLLAAGCTSFSHQIVPCPLSFSEQEKEVLTIAPLGTKRDDVLRRLATAGIEGNFGISQSVYYCDLWNRENGERWHMNLGLQFNDAGVLYKTQAADTVIAPIRDDANKSKAVGAPSDRTWQNL